MRLVLSLSCNLISDKTSEAATSRGKKYHFKKWKNIIHQEDVCICKLCKCIYIYIHYTYIHIYIYIYLFIHCSFMIFITSCFYMLSLHPFNYFFVDPSRRHGETTNQPTEAEPPNEPVITSADVWGKICPFNIWVFPKRGFPQNGWWK